MPKITKASFARAKSALGIKKVTKKNIGRIAKKASGGGKSRSRKVIKGKTKKRTYRKMGKKRKRGPRKFTIPLAPVLGLAAGLAWPAKALMEGNIEGAVTAAFFNYTGYNNQTQQFDINGLKRGLVPLLIGAIIHKFVGGPPLNVNRMLAAANVPVIRI